MARLSASSVAHHSPGVHGVRWLVEGVKVDEERGLFFAVDVGRSGVGAGRVDELGEEVVALLLLLCAGWRRGEEKDLEEGEKKRYVRTGEEDGRVSTEELARRIFPLGSTSDRSARSRYRSLEPPVTFEGARDARYTIFSPSPLKPFCMTRQRFSPRITSHRQRAKKEARCARTTTSRVCYILVRRQQELEQQQISGLEASFSGGFESFPVVNDRNRKLPDHTVIINFGVY